MSSEAAHVRPPRTLRWISRSDEGSVGNNLVFLYPCQLMAIGTKSKLITIDRSARGWGTRAAEAIDEAILKLSADRNVVSVAVTPITSGFQEHSSLGPIGMSSTYHLIVTVIWRDD